MTEELALDQLIRRFDAISNALSPNEYQKPQLKILMRTNWKEKESRFYASLENTETTDGFILCGEYGDGATPEEAMRNYYNKIVGKKLVYRAYSDEYRRECVVV